MMTFEGLDGRSAREFNDLWLPAWSGNRPELLASFYTEDAFYADPENWPGVRGRRALLAYFTKLLKRFPDWTWTHRGSQPMKDGFLNGWHASIPLCGKVVELDGVASVQLRNGLIYRHVVYFDRSPLLAAAPARPRSLRHGFFRRSAEA